ncbi:MAG TPA: hypothetical protein VH643_28190 [Gemmataceae bacterium]
MGHFADLRTGIIQALDQVMLKMEVATPNSVYRDRSKQQIVLCKNRSKVLWFLTLETMDEKIQRSLLEQP